MWAFGSQANAQDRPDYNANVAPEYQYVPDVFSEEVPRGETVRSRSRPELDALEVGS